MTKKIHNRCSKVWKLRTFKDSNLRCISKIQQCYNVT